MLKDKYTTSEKWLESYLDRKIKEAGGITLKFGCDYKRGYPDRLILMSGGRAAWAELKSKGRKPTKLQTLRHDELRGLGFAVYVIDTPDGVDAAVAKIRQDGKV